ncbi:unnamed protein product [Cyclocybe aegerita]|uniref:RWD domain-containing protein n=1 Tax=Cyclocybe aegerita TaxID=1973307 RepID=A0A8S0VVY1_CYCAE|nr:unnamed protein product [Cyclocybe aegerita]
MSRSSSPTTDYAAELQNLLAELSQNPERESVASELEVLQSIYGDGAIRIWHPSSNGKSKNDANVRYEVVMSLPSPHEDISVKVLVSLPTTYPSSSPPQLQLLSRYIGSYGADSNLFGSILRTFISVNGVEWSEDTVCVFDGLQNVLDRCTAWYEERLSAEKAGKLVREELQDHGQANSVKNDSSNANTDDRPSGSNDIGVPTALPAGIQIHTAEPITDRKSAFVGRACRIHHPSEVPLVLAHLMSDRRIFRAAHPIINAWRCQADGILHQG